MPNPIPTLNLNRVLQFICLLILWPSMPRSQIISTSSKQKLYIAKYSQNQFFYILKDVMYIYNYETEQINSYLLSQSKEIYNTLSCWYFKHNNVDYFATNTASDFFVLQKVHDSSNFEMTETLNEGTTLYNSSDSVLYHIFTEGEWFIFNYFFIIDTITSVVPVDFSTFAVIHTDLHFLYIVYDDNKFRIWQNWIGPQFDAEIETTGLFAMKIISWVDNKYLSCFIVGNYDVGCLSITYNAAAVQSSTLKQVEKVWQPNSEIDSETFWLLKISDEKAIVACYSFTYKKFHSKIFNFDLEFSILVEIESDYFNFYINNENSVIGLRSYQYESGNYQQVLIEYFVRKDDTIICTIKQPHQFFDLYLEKDWWLNTMIQFTLLQEDKDTMIWSCDGAITDQPCDFSKISFQINLSKEYDVEYQSSNQMLWTKLTIIGCAENCLTCTGSESNKCTSCDTGYFLRDDTGNCVANSNKFQLEEKIIMIPDYKSEFEIAFGDDALEIVNMGYSLEIDNDNNNKGIFLRTDKNDLTFPYTVLENQILYIRSDEDMVTNNGYVDLLYLYIKKDGIDYSPISRYMILVCSFGCTCDQTSLCAGCLGGHYYFGDDDTKCYNEETKEANWYLWDGTKYANCYEKCATCSTGGAVDGNNCDSCVVGYFFVEDKGNECFNTPPIGDYVFDVETNTYVTCKVYWYVNENNDNVCVDECPNGYPYWKQSKCVNDCGDLLIHRDKCVDTCPSETMKMMSECFDIIKSDEVRKQSIEIKLDVIEVVAEFWMSPSSDIVKELFDSNTQVKGENTILEFVTSFEGESTDNQGVSSIYLGECEIILKSFYSIDSSEYLIIAKLDIFTLNTATPQVEYSVFNKDWMQLDLTLCEDTKIVVSSPINPDALPSLTITQSAEWFEQGIDVFNSSSPFFNDICIPYSTNGTDVNWKDRRKDIFQDVALCEVGCEYKGINYTNSKVTCLCDIKLTPSAEERQKEAENEFIAALSTINIWIIKCVSQMLKPSSYKDNHGFYIILSISIFQLILIIWFYQRNKWLLYQPWFKYSNKFIVNDQNKSLKEVPAAVAVDEETNVDNDDLNDLCFGIAVRHEKRKFVKMWTSILFNRFDIYTKIIKRTEFDILSVNLSIILLNLSIDFTLNAMFFNDDIVSERYHNGGSLSFASTLLLSVLSTIVGFFISKGVDYFSDYPKIWIQFVKEVSMQSQFDKFARIILKKTKIRFWFFFVLEIFIMSFCQIYIMWFCAIYNQSQGNWLLDCLVGSLISITISIICALLASLFRVIGINYYNKTIYNASLYLNGSIG